MRRLQLEIAKRPPTVKSPMRSAWASWLPA